MSDYTQDNRRASITTPLGKDKLLLKSLNGSERVSALFEYKLSLQSTDTEIDPNTILGKVVTITIANPLKEGGTRYINGIVAAFGQSDITDELAEYSALVVPQLWLASLTKDSRIFQKKTVKEILEIIIKTDTGIADFRDSASQSGSAVREYCVQYDETDFAFISRLMEEEGIYYFFEHTDGKHTLVLCDAPNAHHDVAEAATVPFRRRSATDTEQSVNSWAASRFVLPGQFVAADYNFTTPATVLRSAANISRSHSSDDNEIFEYPARFATVDAGNALAKIRICEQQARHIVYTAETTALGLATGSTFTLAQHPLAKFNAKFLILGNQIALENPSYTDSASAGRLIFASLLTVIPAEQEYRPARTTPRPNLGGPHSAVVTGAKDDEVHTDKYVSIKVKFHWDREGKNDENSSIFMRVAQTLSGKGFGSVFIPRVGQEVIVEFMDGDPDRPIITGALYNEANLPTHPLPENKTRNYIRTESFEAPSGDAPGFNEIRFEDKKDAEELFFHASKDHGTYVINDQLAQINHDNHHAVVHNQHAQVHNDYYEAIGGNHNLAIGVGADEVENGKGKGDKIGKVKKGGGQNIKIVGPRRIEIGGKSALLVKSDVVETFEKSHFTDVTEQRFLKAKEVVFEAEDNITFKVGETWLTITPEGIKLNTDKEIVVISTGDTKFEATGNFLVKGTAGVKIESPANVELKATANFLAEGTAQMTVKGAIGEVSASGPLTVKGGVVMIN
jgi:type VI secretion system secreted protein VgrG